jgi:uracil-DNA glycosylase
MLNLNVITQPVDQTWSIERIGRDARPVTWEAVFEDAGPELHDVSTILDEQERMYGMYYPLKKDLFTALHLTPLSGVKVVIIGQDPYPQTISVNGVSLPRAVGLSFSVRQEDSIPSSLQNIYTELANTVKGFVRPDHGDLREWARQGILLLNSCLTVRPGQPGSHGDIWLGFISKVFRAIAAVNPYCIYLLWGREAQKLKPMLGERSIILEAAHPSGLSARRGFFGCNHFNQVNEILIRQGKVGINWRISTLKELRAPSAPVAIPVPRETMTQAFQPKFVPIDVRLPVETNRSPSDTVPQIPQVPLPTAPLPIIPKIITVQKESPIDMSKIGIPQIIGLPTKDREDLLPVIPHTKETIPVEPSTSPVGGAFLPTLFHKRSPTPVFEFDETNSPEVLMATQSPQSPPVPIIPKINFGIFKPDANIIQVQSR